MSGMPGASCDDPREVHMHWCGFCGAECLFAAAECETLRIVPPCDRCGEALWRDEIDSLTLPGAAHD